MANIERLFQIINAGINEPNLDMGNWCNKRSCVTTHCLFGSYLSQYQPDELCLRSTKGNKTYYCITERKIESMPDHGWALYTQVKMIARHLDMSIDDVNYLFIAVPDSLDQDYRKKWVKPAYTLEKNEALKRLIKYTYYKLYKQAGFSNATLRVQSLFKSNYEWLLQ